MRFPPCVLCSVPSGFALRRKPSPNPISDRLRNTFHFVLKHGGRKVPVYRQTAQTHFAQPSCPCNPVFLEIQHIPVRPAAHDVEHRAVSPQPDRFHVGASHIRLKPVQIHKIRKVGQLIAPHRVRNAPQKLPMGVNGVFGNQTTKAIISPNFARYAASMAAR